MILLILLENSQIQSKSAIAWVGKAWIVLLIAMGHLREKPKWYLIDRRLPLKSDPFNKQLNLIISIDDWLT